MNQWTTLWGAALLLSNSALAADEPAPATYDDARAWQQHVERTWDTMTPRRGEIRLEEAGVVLTIPDDFYYLDKKDARTVLEDFWGNPPDDTTLGMLFPSHYRPFDAEAWGVDIAYVEDGHVDDEDADHIDYDELLETMREDIRDANPQRQELGYETLELVGWAEPPHYDPDTHQLYWAKRIHFEGQEGDTLNYNIRKLGREGFLQMNFIADMPALPEINHHREAVLALSRFEEGNRYADYDPDTDHLAAYGVGGLIAGKALAKTGVLAAALLLLKKFWFVLLAGLAALGRKLFRKS
ncbi:DUF2167 domain-containing protein [Alloalcanivorax profundimaris]|uniref:DUF2167 domain-containing protein n=1 Tax=Alloalcanivorax profundimaris TaxID=2735259 RepID=UPI000C4911A0|nr:DUF2167 domain-containing protein [Alloalcanivorax profundimaris]MBF1800722.1 DUF2167 domain-containing protein [Alloalcanivorax profundimaris]MBU59821.1 hypothetical protein [Alcanivorax sp.]